MKEKNWKEQDSTRTKGTKKYQQRLVEEKEAKIEQEEALERMTREAEESGLYNIEGFDF